MGDTMCSKMNSAERDLNTFSVEIKHLSGRTRFLTFQKDFTIFRVLLSALEPGEPLSCLSFSYLNQKTDSSCSLEGNGVSKGSILQILCQNLSKISKLEQAKVCLEEGVVFPAIELLSNQIVFHEDRLLSKIKESFLMFVNICTQEWVPCSDLFEAMVSSGAIISIVDLLTCESPSISLTGYSCVQQLTSLSTFSLTHKLLFDCSILSEICSLLIQHHTSEQQGSHSSALAVCEAGGYISAAFLACKSVISRLLEQRSNPFFSGLMPLQHTARVIPVFHLLFRQSVQCIEWNLRQFQKPEFVNFVPTFPHSPNPCFTTSLNFVRNTLSLVTHATEWSIYFFSLEQDLLSLLRCLLASLSETVKITLSYVQSIGYGSAYGEALKLIPLKLLCLFRSLFEALSNSSQSKPGLLQLVSSALKTGALEQKIPLNALLIFLNNAHLSSPSLYRTLRRYDALLPDSKDQWLRSSFGTKGIFAYTKPHLKISGRARLRLHLTREWPHYLSLSRGPSKLEFASSMLSEAPSLTLRAGLTVGYSGNGESAIGPGVTRDFLAWFAQQCVDPKMKLFVPCSEDKQCFFPNPASGAANKSHLQYFKALGRVVGLSLAANVTLGVRFSRLFYCQLAFRPVTLADVAELDPVLFSSLSELLSMEAADVESLCLTFATSVGLGVEEEAGGSSHGEVELKPGGMDLAVTGANRAEFVRLTLQKKYVESISPQFSSFSGGLRDMAAHGPLSELLQGIDAEEFNGAICGSEGELAVDDWRAHTVYSWGCTAESVEVGWFWEIVEEMAPGQRSALLYFATSVKRMPHGGFSGLVGNFDISMTSYVDRLPTAHTCFLHLFLPKYPTKEIMRSMLMKVVEDGGDHGFAG